MIRWAIYGTALFLVTLVPLVFGPDTPLADEATVSMTMAFAVMGIGTLFSGISIRRDPGSGLSAPILKALGIAAIPAGLLLLATEWALLQQFLMTTPLAGDQWLAVILLAGVVLVVIEVDKAVRRRTKPAPMPVAEAVDPKRAVTTASAGD